ncbi:MAG TPA: DUF4097 domain-containing protein [Chloroflexi bacterium]|nr:DUF4097 domain-containing protein [Chloroflexota bacterium]
MSDHPFETGPQNDDSRRDEGRREYGEPRRSYGEPRGKDRGDRSLFWPIVLIGVGVLWLLSNVGLIADLNIGLLLRLWPLILVVIGLDLLFGRRWPALSALIVIGTVALVVLLLLFAPRLGLRADAPASIFGMPIITGADETDLRTERFTEPLGETESAEVTLNLSSIRADIHGLQESEALIDAEITHYGGVAFVVRGDRRKTIRLTQRNQILLGPLTSSDTRLGWDVGLTPAIPLDLAIDVGSGPADADLTSLRLQSLDVDGGSGPFSLALPEGPTDYRARIDVGSGPITVNVPEGAVLSDLAIEGGSGPVDIAIEAGARLQASVNGGSGSVTVDVPEQAGVRVSDSGSGGFRVPSDYRQVEGRDPDTGVWESPNYASATQRIDLTFDIGSGRVEVR